MGVVLSSRDAAKRDVRRGSTPSSKSNALETSEAFVGGRRTPPGALQLPRNSTPAGRRLPGRRRRRKQDLEDDGGEEEEEEEEEEEPTETKLGSSRASADAEPSIIIS